MGLCGIEAKLITTQQHIHILQNEHFFFNRYNLSPFYNIIVHKAQEVYPVPTRQEQYGKQTHSGDVKEVMERGYEFSSPLHVITLLECRSYAHPCCTPLGSKCLHTHSHLLRPVFWPQSVQHEMWLYIGQEVFRTDVGGGWNQSRFKVTTRWGVSPMIQRGSLRVHCWDSVRIQAVKNFGTSWQLMPHMKISLSIVPAAQVVEEAFNSKSLVLSSFQTQIEVRTIFARSTFCWSFIHTLS